MPRGERSPDQTQITISMPKTLLDDINAEAKADDRSRSNWIVRELAAAVRQRQQMRGVTQAKNFETAGENADAGAGGRSSNTTRPPASLPEPKGDPRLNEDTPALPVRGSKPRVTRARAALKAMIKKEPKK